jgi:hypothetical protein
LEVISAWSAQPGRGRSAYWRKGRAQWAATWAQAAFLAHAASPSLPLDLSRRIRSDSPASCAQVIKSEDFGEAVNPNFISILLPSRHSHPAARTPWPTVPCCFGRQPKSGRSRSTLPLCFLPRPKQLLANGLANSSLLASCLSQMKLLCLSTSLLFVLFLFLLPSRCSTRPPGSITLGFSL